MSKEHPATSWQGCSLIKDDFYPRVESKEFKNARHCLECVAKDEDEDNEEADPGKTSIV